MILIILNIVYIWFSYKKFENYDTIIKNLSDTVNNSTNLNINADKNINNIKKIQSSDLESVEEQKELNNIIDSNKETTNNNNFKDDKKEINAENSEKIEKLKNTKSSLSTEDNETETETDFSNEIEIKNIKDLINSNHNISNDNTQSTIKSKMFDEILNSDKISKCNINNKNCCQNDFNNMDLLVQILDQEDNFNIQDEIMRHNNNEINKNFILNHFSNIIHHNLNNIEKPNNVIIEDVNTNEEESTNNATIIDYSSENNNNIEDNKTEEKIENNEKVETMTNNDNIEDNKTEEKIENNEKVEEIQKKQNKIITSIGEKKQKKVNIKECKELFKNKKIENFKISELREIAKKYNIQLENNIITYKKKDLYNEIKKQINNKK